VTALFEYMTARLLEYFDFVLSSIGQVKFSHDPLTDGYSLGAPLGFHRIHRNACLLVGITSFLCEKLPREIFKRNKAIDRL